MQNVDADFIRANLEYAIADDMADMNGYIKDQKSMNGEELLDLEKVSREQENSINSDDRHHYPSHSDHDEYQENQQYDEADDLLDSSNLGATSNNYDQMF